MKEYQLLKYSAVTKNQGKKLTLLNEIRSNFAVLHIFSMRKVYWKQKFFLVYFSSLIHTDLPPRPNLRH